MVLVFILLAIFILLLAIIFLILLSTFRIEIRDLRLTNMNNEKQEKINNKNKTKKQQSDFAVILSFYLCNKLKWISLHLNDEKMRKAYSKMQLEKIDLKKLEKDFKWEYLKIIKKLHVKLSYLNLKIKLGLENPVVTAFIVSILSAIISIFLPYFATDLKKENYIYNTTNLSE